MKRFLALVTLFAFGATLITVAPASAAPPSLAVIIVDPTVVGSFGSAGTPPFDPPPGNGPGQSPDGKSHIIRTNDVITYDFQYSVNNANATQLTLTSTLPTNGGVFVADYTTLPGNCTGAGSMISANGQTLTCVIGAVTQGSAQDLLTTVKVRTSAPSGFVITNSVTVGDPGTGATAQTTNGYSLNQSTASPTPGDTVTSTVKVTLLKKTALVGPTSTFTYVGEGNVPGYYVTYPILVQEGDGTASGRVGIAVAPDPLTFADSLTVGAGAILPATNACGLNGNGITIPGDPYGALSIGGANTNNSVPSANTVTTTITCTQPGGAGTAVNISVAGSNTTGSSFPLANANGSAVESLSWIVSGYLRVFVPNTALGVMGTNTNYTDSYGSLGPSDPITANHSALITLTSQGPAPPSGNAGKAFFTNTSENGFPFSNAQGPGITAGSQIVAAFAVNNTSNAASGNVDVINNFACDFIDTSKFTVTNFDGTTGPVDATYGGAVRLSNINGGSFADGTPNVTEISYATTNAADCSDVNGPWYLTTAAAIASATGPIQRVRVKGTIPHGTQLRVQINETVNAGLAAGTIVGNTMTDNGAASTGSATPFSTGASTQGQILVTNIAAQKYLFRNTANASLLNPTGPFGSGGFVDPTQQFVAYLDTDGTQSTLPQAGMYTCDFIPANTTIANFDGSTGPINATYGGPVQFATINGTAPATITVEYSTDPQALDTTCRAGTWSAIPPIPYSSITKVRARFDLPQVSKLRMFVNLIVNPGVPPTTVINNTMVTSTGSAPAVPVNAAQSVTVENEIVSIVKTGPAGAVQAGSPGTFTLQPYIQGVGAAQSGLVTITDTLPVGLTYVVGSSVLTAPGAPSTYIPGSGSATPTSVTGGGAVPTVITFNVGRATQAPGAYIQMPTITFSVTPDISIANGASILNTAVISDPNDPTNFANHTGQAPIVVSNAGAFHIAKRVSNAITSINGPITYSLDYSNTGATNAASTDFIDELPYTGDSRGSSFHGNVTFVSVSGTNGETFGFTKAAHGTINDDPGCLSNGGAVGNGVGTCVAHPATTFCPALSGGACPANASEVTAIRITGGALPASSGTRTITINVVTSGNVFTDQYDNTFGARTDIIGLGVHAPIVQTVVPIPPVPFVTLTKSCTAPPNCATTPQAPGTDVTYGITFTNTGAHNAANLIVSDPVPSFLDFKLGTTTQTLPGGLVMTVTYSNNGTTFTYVPVSGGGGAPTGYDRNVVIVRWTLTTGQLGTLAPANTGSVNFTAQVRAQ